MRLEALFLAAAVAAFVLWWRSRERRILTLLAMFLLLAIAHSRSDWFAARPWHIAVAAVGLILLWQLSVRQHSHAPDAAPRAPDQRTHLEGAASQPPDPPLVTRE